MDDYIKLLVKGKKINPGEKHIMVNGIIKDIVTLDEINKFFYKNKEENTINNDNLSLELLF